MMRNRLVVLALGIGISFANVALAADAPKSNAAGAQKIDVDSLKQKYWAKGDDQQLEVVQNRIYTKAGKFTLEADFGTVGGDPFQNTLAYGGLLGYYFNEYLGVDVLYWKMKSSTSSAYDAFKVANQNGYGTNNNPLDSLMGAEVTGSLLYGKLSLIGKAILHFDLMARAGVGRLTLKGDGRFPGQDQTAIVPWFGIGQQLYITTWMSLRFDWRMMWYNQTVIQQYVPAELGTVVGTTQVASSIITGGINFLLF